MVAGKSRNAKGEKRNTGEKSVSKNADEARHKLSPVHQPSLPVNKNEKCFSFFALPAELRVRVYEEILLVREPLDLDPDNFYRVYPRLALFLVSKQMHEEAYRVFYSQSVRLFPKHGRFFHNKKPLLVRLPDRYRRVINTMELLLGPGWSDPPKCQYIHPRLGLDACTSLRTLKIFVSCDPSDRIFDGFRGKNATEETYKWFCVDMLQELIEEIPTLHRVVVDANPGLKQHTPLISGLVDVIRAARLKLIWGPTLLYSDRNDTERSLQRLSVAMTSLSLDDTMSVVQVEA